MVNLKKIREKNGLTQDELAKKLGIKQQQYARYEKGTTKISMEMVEKILSIFHYKIKIVREK